MTDRDRWQTPEPILEFARAIFEANCIELDPATEPSNPTRALRFFTAEKPCSAREGWTAPGGSVGVFLNPPFSLLYSFAERFDSWASEGLFVGSYSIEAKWARLLHQGGCLLLVPHKRIKFKSPPGIPDPKQPYPTTLWYRGDLGKSWLQDAWEETVGTGLEVYE